MASHPAPQLGKIAPGSVSVTRLDRLRLRGPSGAQFEIMLAAIAQNLRRLAKLVAPPAPVTTVACVTWAERSACNAGWHKTIAPAQSKNTLGPKHALQNSLLQQNRP